MNDIPLKQVFAESYPHLPWTPEEEEAFNRIPALEWPRPTLRTVFARRARAVVDSIRTYLDKHPYHVHF